jgi:hypothetical protein
MMFDYVHIWIYYVFNPQLVLDDFFNPKQQLVYIR